MTSLDASVSLSEHFEAVADPRIEQSEVPPLLDEHFLAVTATLSGADGPADIEQFGQEELDWLPPFVAVPGGILSHETIGRLIAAINPDSFQRAFLRWIEVLITPIADGGPQCVPIDDKKDCCPCEHSGVITNHGERMDIAIYSRYFEKNTFCCTFKSIQLVRLPVA